MRYDPTRSAVQRQLRGMGCESYELGVLTERGMLLRTWSAEEVLRALDWLKRENRSGANIYVRADRERSSRLVLIDDLNRDALARLRVSDHAPAVVVQTSPGNWQAWVKLDEDTPSQVRTEVARILCREYGGDPASADAQHFGRLAGFTNRKPARIIDGRPQFVLLRRALTKAQLIAVPKGLTSPQDGPRAVLMGKVRVGDADALSRHVSVLHARLRERFGERYDASRADWLIAVRLYRRGHSYQDVAHIIGQYSPGIDGRKAGHTEDYVQRTAGKAEIWHELQRTGVDYRDVAPKLLDLARERAAHRDSAHTPPPALR